MKTDKDLNFTVDFALIDLIVVYCQFEMANRFWLAERLSWGVENVVLYKMTHMLIAQ